MAPARALHDCSFPGNACQPLLRTPRGRFQHRQIEIGPIGTRPSYSNQPSPNQFLFYTCLLSYAVAAASVPGTAYHRK